MTRILSRISLAFIVAVSLSGLAMAHEHEHRGARSAAQFGYQNGYTDGYQHGRDDRQARAGYNYESRDFDDAMRGYEPYMGSSELYQDGYRSGYRAGYNDGFQNRSAQYAAPYGAPPSRGYGGQYAERGPGGPQSVAFHVGYQDGLIDGEKDAKHNKDFQPSKHDHYEDAHHGYKDDYGSKKAYKREYREGYLAGYRRGYNQLRSGLNR